MNLWDHASKEPSKAKEIERLYGTLKWLLHFWSCWMESFLNARKLRVSNKKESALGYSEVRNQSYKVY